MGTAYYGIKFSSGVYLFLNFLAVHISFYVVRFKNKCVILLKIKQLNFQLALKTIILFVMAGLHCNAVLFKTHLGLRQQSTIITSETANEYKFSLNSVVALE